jgi:hypothetical protein
MAPSRLYSSDPEPPEGAIRRWPTGLPWDEHLEETITRPIRVEITTWRGSCPDAVHFKLTVEEEKNCWWDAEGDQWVDISVDLGAVGLNVSACLFSYEACVDLSIHALLAIAGKAGVKKRPIRWLDGRNGDDMPTKVLKALKRKKR